MPALGTEPIDYTPAKIVYAATGSLKQAAERTGISYDAIRKAASRHNWEMEVKQAQEIASLNVTRAMGAARNSLEENGKRARELHAKAAVTVAQTLSEMDGQELLLSAQQMAQTAKHAQTVFGWAIQTETKVSLDILASGQGAAQPLVDVDAEVFTEWDD